MRRLVYAAIMSLDGFIEDADGRFDWAVPDPEVHAFVNALEASIGTHMYGRRMYETMAVWQTAEDDPSLTAAEAAYAAQWQALDKIVYSRTLDDVWTPRTRLERTFDAEAVVRLKQDAGSDISVSGPGLAEHAFRARLVDEVHLFAIPIVVGGGKPGIPRGLKLDLELLAERRFANGVVHAHYRVVNVQ